MPKRDRCLGAPCTMFTELGLILILLLAGPVLFCLDRNALAAVVFLFGWRFFFSDVPVHPRPPRRRRQKKSDSSSLPSGYLVGSIGPSFLPPEFRNVYDRPITQLCRPEFEAMDGDRRFSQ